VDAHFLLAECYRLEKNYQMSIVEYRYCLNLTRKPMITTENEIREGLVECYLELEKEALTQRDKVATKDAIADAWAVERGESGPGSIEVYIHRLRKKIEQGPIHIATVRGLGYCLEKIPG